MQTQYTTERKGSPYEQPVGRAASLKTQSKVDNGLRSQIERGDRVCAFRGLRPLWPHPFGLRPLSFSPSPFFPSRFRTRGRDEKKVGTFSRIWISLSINRNLFPSLSHCVPSRIISDSGRDINTLSLDLYFPLYVRSMSRGILLGGGGCASFLCDMEMCGVSLSGKRKCSFRVSGR